MSNRETLNPLSQPHSLFTHRTRGNVAIMEGLAYSLSSHVSDARIALMRGNEAKLQAALADLIADAKAFECAVVEQEQ